MSHQVIALKKHLVSLSYKQSAADKEYFGEKLINSIMLRM